MISLDDLSYLSNLKNVAVFGCNGAIGAAFVDVFKRIDSIETIACFSRSEQKIFDDKIIHRFFDYTDEQSIIDAKVGIDSSIKFDLILITTGMLHDQSIMPEKSLTEYSAEKAQHYFLMNTIGPSMIIKHFSSLLNKSAPSIIATLCARIGSISDNRLGGWYSYRSSKAAMMMMIKSASIELKRKNSNIICVGLHPGTVDSKLSQPFHKHIKQSMIISPEDSVKQLLQTISELSLDHTGYQFAYDGEQIPF